MTTIYEQHRAAFAQTEAYVIARNGERVATVAFKFPRDGVGRLYAYVHWLGLEMVRGWASGCGYDKRTAACAGAMGAMGKVINKASSEDGKHAVARWNAAGMDEFRQALAKDGGQTWDSALRAAGFDVWQAV